MTIPASSSSSSSTARKSTAPPPSVSATTPAHAPRGSRDGKRGYRRASDGCSNCCTVLVGVLLVGFGCAAMVVYRYYGLDWNVHNYHDGDMVRLRSWGTDLNSVLCEQYRVTSGDLADVFLLDGPAKISQDLRDVIAVQDSGLTANDHFDFRAFHLLPGSEVNVRACLHDNGQLRQAAEIVIVKGDDSFNAWLADPACSTCAAHRVPLPPDGVCVVAAYVVEKHDNYYVIMTRAQRWDAGLPLRAEVDMVVSKTMYDLSSTKQACFRSRTCTLNLTYDAHDDVIVTFPGQAAMPVTSASFMTECQLRAAFWAVVFGIVPCGLACVLSACCMIRSRRSAALRQKKRQAGRPFTVSDAARTTTHTRADNKV